MQSRGDERLKSDIVLSVPKRVQVSKMNTACATLFWSSQLTLSVLCIPDAQMRRRSSSAEPESTALQTRRPVRSALQDIIAPQKTQLLFPALWVTERQQLVQPRAPPVPREQSALQLCFQQVRARPESTAPVVRLHAHLARYVFVSVSLWC